MLPKNHRLRKKRDIERVFKNGKSAKEGFLVLKSAKNGLGASRFGFIVSSKVSKKAVTRNKIRRRLSELIGVSLKRIKPGYDNLLIVLSGPETKDFRELKEVADKLFSRIKLFND